MPELLIELFSEEIPARMQGQAAEDLKRMVTQAIAEAGLSYSQAKAFATPRRLTLVLMDMPPENLPVSETRKGPRVDAPEKAIKGFLHSTGLEKKALEIRKTPKGQFYFATLEGTARRAQEIIGEVLEPIIRTFPWPKSMRWGDGTLRWVRPLHRILCIFGDGDTAEIIPLKIDHLSASNITEGHRVHASIPFEVTGFENYQDKLKARKVILDPQARRKKIRADIETLAFAAGLEMVEDTALLDEVAGLVEWPIALSGEIDADFLDLPSPVLQSSMRTHQKFFSVRAPKSQRIERFITIANIETDDGGKRILAGNQRVLRARLADAKFFWENDLRRIGSGKDTMGEWRKQLENVTFQSKLGTQAERVERIVTTAGIIARALGFDAEKSIEAARLCKADLCSEMVNEFPDLQGVMGRFYAQKAGVSDEIATAIQDHYAPLGRSNPAPEAPLSLTVALADKIDLLCGFWSIDAKPTGSKDPFALRRAGLGIIRIILENKLHLDLKIIFEGGFERLGAPKEDELTRDLLRFIHDRVEVFLKGQNLRYDVIRACLAVEVSDLTLCVARAKAVNRLLEGESGQNLIQAYRRSANILAQAEKKDGVSYSFGADVKFAEAAEEAAVFAALERATPLIKAALEKNDFDAAIEAMAALRGPIDGFFEAVKINSENEIIRRNRLNFLDQIRKIMEEIADFSQIEG